MPPTGAVPPTGEVRVVGDAAVVVGVAGPEAARVAADAVRRAGWAGVVDVVPGMSSVLVVVDPAVTDPVDVEEGLRVLRPPPPRPVPPAHVVVPAVFDGEDLRWVADRCGSTAGALVAALTGAELRVATVGFSPGFAYLQGLPEPLRSVPRRPTPRPFVPAGSVAVAGGFAAVYPQATPGGWQLLGRTGRVLFDPSTPPYAFLRPGDRVRFAAAAPAGEPPSHRAGVRRPAGPEGDTPRAPWRLRPDARPGFRVVAPGLLDLVQDRGRNGVAHLGVAHAGSADPVGSVLANRLVGNSEDAAALEVTGAGPTLEWRRDTYVALAGAEVDAHLDGRPVPAGCVVPVASGQHLRIGATQSGLRTYVAAAGGLVVPELFGSRSTDVLSSLGPGPLGPGDEVGTGQASPPLGGRLASGRGDGVAPGSRTRRMLRVVPGPHGEWFGDGAVERLASVRFEVLGSSDRVGIRLRPLGGPPVARAAGELAPQGMVTGAVQVPPDGQPIVLLPDHATMGGYPVIAVVASVDQAELGQCRPGDEVAFEPVDVRAARAALARLRRDLGSAVVGHYPVAAG